MGVLEEIRVLGLEDDFRKLGRFRDKGSFGGHLRVLGKGRILGSREGLGRRGVFQFLLDM